MAPSNSLLCLVGLAFLQLFLSAQSTLSTAYRPRPRLRQIPTKPPTILLFPLTPLICDK
ncbi:hypothetical protein ASPFODRAFT_45175 [Aspergillus luchuensis CBS 106.47]|uniref:Uncharacterized protein n=1 Tax=Aspergillus luchuensis (strain CBS 106.47) TaxID=1137211 RepID=A0A1M3TKZ0_ASPLC|nr:hypothetical protein ASPFODRAFT_45175 [Aspergillus luchuensis CBS 106.47]